MDPKISECWEELSDFIIFRNSLDLGALSKLQQLLTLEAAFDPPVFADQITTFLTAISSQSKIRPQGETDILAILSIDSLINNLYLENRNGETFQPRSSSFYGWMSSSQMSIDRSNVSQRESQFILEWISELANSEHFFKRLKASIQKKNQQRVKKYIECLLETIDAILGREKISRETFLKLRGKYIGLQSKRMCAVDYQHANSVIFSSQLNKIVAVLAQGGDHVHLALLRIYLFYSQDSKMFEDINFSGDQMLTNLYRYYVNSFKQIEELFEQGKHPIFRFLRNHLALLFTPVLRKFHKLVAKIAPKCGNQSGFAFYRNGLSVLDSQLGDFINDLPGDLLRLLSMLRDLVEEQHPGQSQFAISAVKKMFFYSFLLNQPLIEQVYPRHDPGKWGVAYNHILNLFFQGSIKKFGNLVQSQQNQIGQLIEKMAGNMDNRIVNQYIQLETEGSLSFRARETILNHDYELVLGVLGSLEFTPKDSKQFEMKKIQNVAPESPVYKHLKGHNFKTEEGHEELELATWMSVGGTREWGVRPSRMTRGGVAERLKGLKTISIKLRTELEQESATWGAYLKG